MVAIALQTLPGSLRRSVVSKSRGRGEQRSSRQRQSHHHSLAASIEEFDRLCMSLWCSSAQQRSGARRSAGSHRCSLHGSPRRGAAAPVSGFTSQRARCHGAQLLRLAAERRFQIQGHSRPKRCATAGDPRLPG